MKVKIIKLHQSYAEEFKVGEIVELERVAQDSATAKSWNDYVVISQITGHRFLADEMCKAFSNHCSYADLFVAVNPDGTDIILTENV